MQLYPKKDTLFNSISFKDGEYFSTSRFRPVQINFNKFDLLNKAELLFLSFLEMVILSIALQKNWIFKND